MRTAVVVGAGVGGLAAAGALARSGWQVTLLERADRLRAEPHRAGALAQRRRGRCGRSASAPAWTRSRTPLPDGGRPPPRRALAGAAARPRRPTGAPVVVHREDLHDALIAGLGDRVEIRTGVTVRQRPRRAGERPGVSDGRHTVEADLVVAADGAGQRDARAGSRPSPQWSAPAAPPGGR